MFFRFKFADAGENTIAAAVAFFHRNFIHAQDNISSKNQLFPFNVCSKGACMDSPAPGERPFCHSLNKNTCRLGQIKCLGETPVYEKTFDTKPERFLFQQESPRCI